MLTLAAWALLAYWMRGALLLIGDWLWYPIFELSTYAAPDWKRIWSRLAPYLVVSALLATWLVYWAVRRRATLMRQQSMSQPAPLDLAIHAVRFGLHADDVLSLREARIVTVAFDADGGIADRRVGV